MGATLDGMIAGSGAVFEAKFMLSWSFSEEAAAEKHMAQLQHNMCGDPDEFDAVVDYFRLGCRGLRSRRPSPSPSENSIPARCKAIRIALTASSETTRRSFSKSTTVESPRLAARASCDWVISRRARAARHWPGVIVSTSFIDMSFHSSYQ
jgi:hypothetical protein